MIGVWVRYAVDAVLPWRQGTSRLMVVVVYWTWRHQTLSTLHASCAGMAAATGPVLDN